MTGLSNRDYLAKRLIWDELQALSGRVLDFGSGSGETASHLSETCEVTAVEPDENAVSRRAEGRYTQLVGGVELLDGKNSGSALFGTINYYDDGEIASVCPNFRRSRSSTI